MSEAVRILRLATGGDGVGKLADGRTVFVPRTAPGDLVELTPPRLLARFARARVARLVEPGPGRVSPRCKHYIANDCGGCQLQHLDLETQLEAKRGFVEDALQRIGHLEVRVPPLIPADAEWSYRTRISLAIGPGRRFAGFHPLDEPTRVFALERCEIAAEPLNSLWDALKDQLHLLPDDVEQLVLRVDRVGQLHVVVKAEGGQAWGKGKRLAEALAARGPVATVWWQPAHGAPRVMSGDRGAFPATVFEQVHPSLGDRIRAWALDHLRSIAGVHAWDLYSGIGETTAELAARGATVESVEVDRRAVELAERRSRPTVPGRESQRPETTVVERHVGRVEDLIGKLRAPNIVIANPPRAGMDPRVVNGLLEHRPVRLVYVSCDPSTLARDLSKLCGTSIESPSRRAVESPGRGAYRITAVQPFDLFPETAHVETVAVLEA